MSSRRCLSSRGCLSGRCLPCRRRFSSRMPLPLSNISICLRMCPCARAQGSGTEGRSPLTRSMLAAATAVKVNEASTACIPIVRIVAGGTTIARTSCTGHPLSSTQKVQGLRNTPERNMSSVQQIACCTAASIKCQNSTCAFQREATRIRTRLEQSGCVREGTNGTKAEDEAHHHQRQQTRDNPMISKHACQNKGTDPQS